MRPGTGKHDTVAVIHQHWENGTDNDGKDRYTVVWLTDALESGSLDPDRDGHPRLHLLANVDDPVELGDLMRDMLNEQRYEWSEVVWLLRMATQAVKP